MRKYLTALSVAAFAFSAFALAILAMVPHMSYG